MDSILKGNLLQSKLLVEENINFITKSVFGQNEAPVELNIKNIVNTSFTNFLKNDNAYKIIDQYTTEQITSKLNSLIINKLKSKYRKDEDIVGVDIINTYTENTNTENSNTENTDNIDTDNTDTDIIENTDNTENVDTNTNNNTLKITKIIENPFNISTQFIKNIFIRLSEEERGGTFCFIKEHIQPNIIHKITINAGECNLSFCNLLECEINKKTKLKYSIYKNNGYIFIKSKLNENNTSKIIQGHDCNFDLYFSKPESFYLADKLGFDRKDHTLSNLYKSERRVDIQYPLYLCCTNEPEPTMDSNFIFMKRIKRKTNNNNTFIKIR